MMFEEQDEGEFNMVVWFFFFFLLQLKKLRMFATKVFFMCYKNAGMQVAAILIHVSDGYCFVPFG